MKWWMIVGLGLLAGLLAAYVALSYADGPKGPLRGGKLVAGELVGTAGADWLAATRGKIKTQDVPYFIEFELANAESSRTTGILLHDGEIYIPCDLGFGWARMSGLMRWILNGIYLVKDWHQQVRDGDAVVLRMEGNRYALKAHRVTDAALIESLKQQMEGLTAKWQSPVPLAPRPTQGPKDIWFFHLKTY